MPMTQYSPEKIKDSITGKLRRYFGCEIGDATSSQIYQAVASTVRDQVMEQRTSSRGQRKLQHAKKLYYMSAEFLVGRTMHNNMINLLNEDMYKIAFADLGVSLDKIEEMEPEPGLGNGGLGRLAACFMDSLSTLDLPAMGCSIRYEFGLFRQKIVDGHQVEMPDNWLAEGNIWEIAHPNETVEVHFGGYILEDWSEGKLKIIHKEYDTVLAVPYDMPVLGYDTTNVNMLRLWSARSPQQLDMGYFNRGQYNRAVEEKELAAVISMVLYPEDNHLEGKELRLKQQYFFSSATVQHAIRDFKNIYGTDWGLFPQKVALHVNDTHPGFAIPELMRLLIDEEGLTWERAETITRESFAYTNHTVMQEALERWNEGIVQLLLPRIYSILVELNKRLCAKLWDLFPGQWDRIGHMAIIASGQIHMANLCNVMSHSVNGVSQIHGEIIKNSIFVDFYKLEPQKYSSITNGITHRRWLMQANPALSSLLDETIGTLWRKDAERLSDLNKFAEDAAFQDAFYKVKRINKERLNEYFQKKQNISLNCDSIFDVQAKRLHEYKRQLLNILHINVLYNRIVDDPNYEMYPRTFIFGAKASPGYYMAKLIIRYINALATLVEAHPRAKKLLKIVFLENYCVSAAELLIPAAEVSEQLSTAGKEASGTGNMKFMMNGAITIGTMDGANVEIFNQVGKENIYIFGQSAEEVDRIYAYQTYRSSEIYETKFEVRKAMEQMINGVLCPDNPRLFQDIYHSLLFGYGGMADVYLVLKDFASYRRAQERIQHDYADKDKWLKMAIINTANSGFFSSDRAIKEYNDKIWHMEPLKL